MARRRRKRLPEGSFPAHIDDLSHDGRGVARVEGKAVFIDGALPGEAVRFVYRARYRHYDEGQVVEVLQPSPDRVAPRCAHAGICGGCSLQHLRPEAQILAKDRLLRDNLERIGGVAPARWLSPLTGPLWGYRHKARLGVKYVPRKGGVLVGFREKRSSYVARLERCEVLHPQVGERLPALADLIGQLSVRDRIPQIEVAVGDGPAALVLRHLAPLPESDRARLRAFAAASELQLYLQPGGPETVTPLWPEAPVLSYTLPESDLTLSFEPTDFTQVNPAMNRRMLAQALDLLDPGPEDRVLDLFCGLGNFTLPLARRARQVTGVEGEAGLVQRVRDNAARNGITNAEFHLANLMQDVSGAPWLGRDYEGILLDPPRSGAQEVIPHVARLGARRILYVSCHPASLARDAGLLVRAHGYRLVVAGVMDMFPHTAHVESMALFESP